MTCLVYISRTFVHSRKQHHCRGTRQKASRSFSSPFGDRLEVQVINKCKFYAFIKPTCVFNTNTIGLAEQQRHPTTTSEAHSSFVHEEEDEEEYEQQQPTNQPISVAHQLMFSHPSHSQDAVAIHCYNELIVATASLVTAYPSLSINR